ncbi:GNAT family N-acetyltransferase [Streptomyces sp. C11-1]|uniref:GNAT family N-acetyltransferase n=1 Tax=Streptomyces durocortorensis TaxID=2811104 RepID=A0ABY9VNB0_9ACTN|nr:GNAT family N-acetyltransferase [Streptomyces durocortorensis]WNF25422.1 GNAT family N-acetyltransferase [Streptomyces durocortorensis]
MTTISRLRPGHADALLAFERENRAYFSASVPDRGDDYFAGFAERHRELLAEQDAGLHHFHLIEDADGTVLGRINLVQVENGSAELGYRIAEKAAGRGLATRAVQQVCVLAVREYGLTELRAETTLDNSGSRAVLARTGFEPVEDVMFGDRPGRRYVLDLRRGAPLAL